MARPAHLNPASLSRRDRQILRDLARVRLLTGSQLERLHFTGIATANARGSARRRSLARLRDLRLVTTLPRQVGGVRAGSAGLVYTLDARGHRDRALWDHDAASEPGQRIRRPWAIGWMFVSHSLDVAELYVQLREAERVRLLQLLTFEAEPRSWFPIDGRITLKPDAHLVLESDGWERHYWIEVDEATESLPTLRRKLARYVDLFRSGVAGPYGVLPRVLVTVPNERRASQARELAEQLLGSDQPLIVVARFDQALGLLPGEAPRPPP